jgi:predicted DNA-binding helix-hairpin-helix protein
MGPLDRLIAMSALMELEPAEETGCPNLDAHTPEAPIPTDGAPRDKADRLVIHNAIRADGSRMALLKTLLTSGCERNCFYCPFRAGRDFRRLTFKPDEMAETFMRIHRAGVAQGIFLSSGMVGGGVRTQDGILAVAEILRGRLGYRGYLHLKIMPGAERDQVERVMQLADRVSINLEAPNTDRLARLAPRKEFMVELLQPMRWVEEIRRNIPARQGWNGRWPSMTTQFVVGAAGESDLELLQTTDYLNRSLRLSRAYFSAFRPIADTPLENLPPESPLRQHRLYQASFLLRDYGFTMEDMPFIEAGRLPLHTDPKLAWAQAHLSQQPVEVNRAERQELLRIPGIGPKGAAAIIQARRQGRLHSIQELRKLNIQSRRAAPFILLDGKRPVQPLQMDLFAGLPA